MDFITGTSVRQGNPPDIVIDTFGKNTSEIYAMVFHEAAHYSHKVKVSNFYWANVQYQAIFDKTSGTYGDGLPTYTKYTIFFHFAGHFPFFSVSFGTFFQSTFLQSFQSTFL